MKTFYTTFYLLATAALALASEVSYSCLTNLAEPQVVCEPCVGDIQKTLEKTVAKVFKKHGAESPFKRRLRDGRELQFNCAKSCANNPSGWVCIFYCGGGGRRLQDGYVMSDAEAAIAEETSTAMEAALAVLAEKSYLDTAPQCAAALSDISCDVQAAI